MTVARSCCVTRALHGGSELETSQWGEISSGSGAGGQSWEDRLGGEP